ncbi:hypothetical protein GCM10023080_075060 [Streptomyces pseudoechinosporeus]
MLGTAVMAFSRSNCCEPDSIPSVLGSFDYTIPSQSPSAVRCRPALRTRNATSGFDPMGSFAAGLTVMVPSIALLMMVSGNRVTAVL